MAKVKITLNDGSTKIVQLDDNFTDADIEEVTNSLNSSLDLQGQGTEKSPFRLAVEKVAEPYIDYEKGVIQGLTSLPNALAKKGANKIRPLIGKKPLTDEELAQASWLYDKPDTFIGNLGYAVGSAAPTFLLPEVKAVQGIKGANAINRALTGAYQGGLIGGTESLANEGDLSGVVPGAVGGTVLNTGLPVVGNLAEKSTKLLPMAGGFMGRALGRIQPETLKQAVKPNSIALDLDRAGAENLLMNTTERVQQGYKNLLDKAGEQIQEAALRLPEKRVVFTSELKNKLDNIFKGSQVSNNPKLNPALNGNSDIYKKVSNWTDAGVNQEALTAPEMYDVMTNIKQNIPIDWEKPTASARNALKQQVYGAYADRLSKLSPELKKANAEYAKLAQFENNEGVRRILNPPKKGDIDTASSALKNYNSTVTKGNTNRNIQDLENILVSSGEKPFLNEIDDVNAAMDLLNARTTGDSWLANIATQATRPALKLARYANRKGLPQAYERLKRALPQNFVPYVYGIKELIDRD